MGNEMGNRNVTGFQEENNTVVETPEKCINEDSVKEENGVIHSIDGKDFVEKLAVLEFDNPVPEKQISDKREQRDTEVQTHGEPVKVQLESKETVNMNNGIQPDFSTEEVNDSENPMDFNLENESLEHTSNPQELRTSDEERISSSDAKADHAEPRPLYYSKPDASVEIDAALSEDMVQNQAEYVAENTEQKRECMQEKGLESQEEQMLDTSDGEESEIRAENEDGIRLFSNVESDSQNPAELVDSDAEEKGYYKQEKEIDSQLEKIEIDGSVDKNSEAIGVAEDGVCLFGSRESQAEIKVIKNNSPDSQIQAGLSVDSDTVEKRNHVQDKEVDSCKEKIILDASVNEKSEVIEVGEDGSSVFGNRESQADIKASKNDSADSQNQAGLSVDSDTEDKRDYIKNKDADSYKEKSLESSSVVNEVFGILDKNDAEMRLFVVGEPQAELNLLGKNSSGCEEDSEDKSVILTEVTKLIECASMIKEREYDFDPSKFFEESQNCKVRANQSGFEIIQFDCANEGIGSFINSSSNSFVFDLLDRQNITADCDRTLQNLEEITSMKGERKGDELTEKKIIEFVEEEKEKFNETSTEQCQSQQHLTEDSVVNEASSFEDTEENLISSIDLRLKKDEQDKPVEESRDREAEERAGRLSTESNSERRNMNVEVRKSRSFDFDLPLEARTEESDQTPLLYTVKVENPVAQSESDKVGKGFNKAERSNLEKSRGSFLSFLKEEEEAQGNAVKEVTLTSPEAKGKRKQRSSLFTNCICCAAVIN